MQENTKCPFVKLLKQTNIQHNLTLRYVKMPVLLPKQVSLAA